MAFKTAAEMFGNGILIPTPGAFGPQVPFDTSNPPGTYTGNRGIQFGEQLTAAIANRTHYALALNDEDLNTRVAVFEADGLDAAYRGGALATPGSGRLIVKDGGAVETTSALLTQYADDVSNAHFRADAIGDTTSGGGFDFRGSAFANPAYGMLSRLNFSPAVTHTTMAAGEPIDLNPVAVGGDVIRFINPVHNGTLTDLALDGLDFIEISGAGVDNGLYRVFALGAATTDLILRRLDGSAPSFPINGTGVATYFIANAATSSKVGITAGLAVSATASENAVLAIMGRDTDGLLGTGPTEALAFYYQRDDGGSTSLAYFTSTGRLKSGITGGEIGSKAREIERAEGGLPIVNVNKSEGSGDGYHEIGVLVTDQDGVTSSYTGLETRGRLIESLTLGIGASVNGEYTAALGVIELTDSDGLPLPPPGPGVLHGQWTTLVQPGSTLVKILTGVGAGRYYLLSSVTVDANPTNRDTMTLRRLDGTALSVGELPASGLLTFAFYARTTVGGRTAPIVVNSGPGSWTAPTDVTPNAVFHPATDVYGSADSDGVTAAMFAGGIIGARIDDTPTVAAGSHTLDVSWSMSRDGDLYTQGSLVSSASGSTTVAKVTPTTVRVDNPTDSAVLDSSGVSVTSAPFQGVLTAASLQLTTATDTASVLATQISVTNGTDLASMTPTQVTLSDGGTNQTTASPLQVEVVTATDTGTLQAGYVEFTDSASTIAAQLTNEELEIIDSTGTQVRVASNIVTVQTPTSLSSVLADRVRTTDGTNTSEMYADRVVSNDFQYDAALTRTFVVSAQTGVSNGADWAFDTNIAAGVLPLHAYWVSSGNSKEMVFPLPIPNDCSIANVKLLVGARGSVIAANALTARLLRSVTSFGSPAAPPTLQVLGTEYATMHGSAVNVVDDELDLRNAPNSGSGFGVDLIVGGAGLTNNEYFLHVRSNTGVGFAGGAGELVYAIQVQLKLNRPGVL